MEGVRRAQLPIRLDSITPGDGDCFSRAVWSQCQRPEVAQALQGHQALRSRNHQTLKAMLDNFIKKTNLAVVMEMKQMYEREVQPVGREEDGGREETWDAYWRRMLRVGEWADGIFIQGMAWFLRHDIIIVMDTATPQQPYITVSGSWEGPDGPCAGAPLVLGYVESLHYQSLLPLDEQPFRPRLFNPRTTEDTIKDAKNQKNHKIQHQNKDQEKKTEAPDGFVFKSSNETVKITESKEEAGGYICPFCHTEQTRLPSHMMKCHKDEHEDMENLVEVFKKYVHNKRQAKSLAKKNDEDSENVKKFQRENKAKSLAKKNDEDSENVKTFQREKEAKSQAKKNQQAKSPAEMFAASRQKYHEEIMYGPIFPCVCCHRLLFRSNVIEMTEATISAIRRKAEEARARGKRPDQQVKGWVSHKILCYTVLKHNVFVSTCC
jgi:hypothetical protein